MDEQFWDEKYGEQDQLWSGEPNGLLVVEATDLAPGRALDLGCGEGADAIWLAERGWQVSAVDISRVALDRAAAHGAAVAGKVTWIHADLTVTAPPDGPFDLVSALYFTLAREPEHTALRRLLAAVAPGGTLLVGGHDLWGHQHDHAGSPIDPADYYAPGEIAELLDETWTVQTNETRSRVSPSPPGTAHIKDVLLKAHRHP